MRCILSDRTRADIVFWSHCLLIFILFAGLILSCIWRWYRPIHGLILGTTLVLQLRYPRCPLTVLENRYRQRYDAQLVYDEPFVTHYLRQHFGLIVPLRALIVAMGGLTLGTLAMWWLIN